MRSLRDYRARAGAAVLVLLATWETGVLISVRRSAPTEADWRAASDFVHRAASDGALIVFAPQWIDPVGRLWLGDRIAVKQVARMDDARYGEIWEISTRGASYAGVSGRTPAVQRRFGALLVREFLQPGATVTWELTDRSRIQEIDFAPRHGIVVELGRLDDERRLRFDDVQLGTELQVFAGLADYRTRYDNRATALLSVMVDGREVTRGYAGNNSGWVPLPPASTVPGLHRVELLAQVGDRHGPVHIDLCVAAEARSRVP